MAQRKKPLPKKKKAPTQSSGGFWRKLVALLWIGFLVGIAGLVALVFAVQANAFGLFGGLPSAQQLENPTSDVASEIYFADGTLMGKYFLENRTPVRYDELSPNLIKALYATEDIRFDEHSGADGIGTFRAVWGVMTGNRQGGGSTISQQLAKILFNTRTEESFRGPIDNILITKIKEWIVAVRLERAYTKREIMTMYFNQFDFLYNAKGIRTAAQTYFNKRPDELPVEEAAVLVGMFQNPNRNNPVRDP
ncbi:MAG: biosynthetic peptidoglycan transglycosylase, partial [Catalinimonas sp.]